MADGVYNMTLTRCFKETKHLFASHYRVIPNRGGTRSGKTYSILMFIVILAANGHKVRAFDVCSESLPHLKRGAIKDATEIVGNLGVDVDYNKSDHVMRFASGSELRFFPTTDWGKVKGSRRDVLFINEANRIPWEVYRQLAVRTTEKIILDWNPDSEYWYEEKLLGREDVAEPIVTTYKDNPFLSDVQVAEIEANKDDENWWRVYGLGLVGKAEGVVYKRWEQTDEIPADATLVGRGLDFGFTNDPTAIVDVYYQGGYLLLDERCYQRGLTNDKIADRLRGLEGWTIADSAEMKSITEIYNYGIKSIEPAIKGNDSIRHGIQVLQRYPMKVTSRSLNLIKELRNYKYKQDPITGQWLNEPIDKFNHLLDAVRYVALNRLKQDRDRGYVETSLGEI